MENYELNYLLSHGINTETQQKIAGRIESFIQEKGGLATIDRNSKEVKLAYQINGKSVAIMVSIKFQTAPNNLNQINNFIKEASEIIRFSISKHNKARPMNKTTRIAPARRKRLETKEERKVDLKKMGEKIDELLENSPANSNEVK